MWPCRQTVYSLLLFIICILHVRSNDLVTKFDIVLKTPDNTTLPTELPHKSVNVKYTMQNVDEQFNIIGIEPQIQEHQRAIEQLTVRICNSIIYQTIWYDDQATCDNTQSMLIYEWKPNYSLTPFRLPDETAFEFTRTKTLILTVVYRKEKRIHKEQSGVVLYISTLPIRFKMATMLLGNQQQGIHFSCRSSTVPRLLFGGKKLTSEKNSRWWRIYLVRSRPLNRKTVQPVLDSDNLPKQNQSSIESAPSDSFFISGDYLLLECENISQTNCYFLLYYMYKSKPTENENFCQHNDHPNLFKLLPSKELISNNATTTKTFGIDGSTVFLTIGILLFVTWISIIIGCIIMRHIRGLVNFRTEPSSPLTAQKNKLLAYRGRGPQDNFHNRTGDADHIMQIDGEHGG